MAAQRDTRLFFVKTFSTKGGLHDEADALVRKMIGVRGANIRDITTKIRGTRINLSSHSYTDNEGNVVPKPNLVCAVIRANDEVTARLVVTELSKLKDKCENPAQLTWTPKNKAPGAFIGRGASIIRSFNKKHNVRCWFDNKERHFVIESIERRNVLAAVADLDRQDASPSSRPPAPPSSPQNERSTNSFAALVEEEQTQHTIILDDIKTKVEPDEFPSIGAVAGAGAPRGRWGAQREETMTAITSVPVPPPKPKKAPRQYSILRGSPTHIRIPMHSLDDDTMDDGICTASLIAAADAQQTEWWDDNEDVFSDDGFSPRIRRQTSLNEDFGPWRTGEAPAGVITIPCLCPDGSLGEAALSYVE